MSEPVYYGDLVYEFKRIVSLPTFSAQSRKIFNRYKKMNITWISCDSLHSQIRCIAMFSSFIARQGERGSGLGLNDAPNA